MLVDFWIASTPSPLLCPPPSLCFLQFAICLSFGFSSELKLVELCYLPVVVLGCLCDTSGCSCILCMMFFKVINLFCFIYFFIYLEVELMLDFNFKFFKRLLPCLLHFETFKNLHKISSFVGNNKSQNHLRTFPDWNLRCSPWSYLKFHIQLHSTKTLWHCFLLIK